MGYYNVMKRKNVVIRAPLLSQSGYGVHSRQIAKYLLNRKDFVTQRSLQLLVGKRRSLLTYLKNKDIVRYRNIVAELGLRK